MKKKTLAVLAAGTALSIIAYKTWKSYKPIKEQTKENLKDLEKLDYYEEFSGKNYIQVHKNEKGEWEMLENNDGCMESHPLTNTERKILASQMNHICENGTREKTERMSEYCSHMVLTDGTEGYSLSTSFVLFDI